MKSELTGAQSRRALRRVAAAVVGAALLLGIGADLAPAQDAGAVHDRPLRWSDDPYPPPLLPQPLDRHLRAEIVSFDGVRIKLRWDWSDPEQLADFERFVPVRKTLAGGFVWEEGGLVASGTAGLRLRLGMLADLHVRVPAKLEDPHDLGVVLAKPGSSDESILCLLQDRLFTTFDAAAGNTNMINKMGGIPTTTPGHVEFRYVVRQPLPKLASGADVTLDVLRKGPVTRFTIGHGKGQSQVLEGPDVDTAMTHFTPGLYVSGGAARFGVLEIEGAIDAAWCERNGVVPQIVGDLLSKGNRLDKKATKAAERVLKFTVQPDASELEPDDPEREKLVSAAEVAKHLGDLSLPLVVRIRAAEALTDGAFDGGPAAARVSELLDGADLGTRVLAWQVLRPLLPWHFRYEADGDPKVRREAALLVGSYFSERDDAWSEGKVFVDGQWYTPARADAVRGEWESAWDLRSPTLRLRTNLSREWADWYFAALHATYERLVELVGHEPPPDALPLTVFVFKGPASFEQFCKDNGFESRASWGQFVDGDEALGCVTCVRQEAPQWALNALAKLFLRGASGRVLPDWLIEGRAAWFGSGYYHTAKWDGRALEVGLRATGNTAKKLQAAVANERAWTIDQILVGDPRTLDVKQRTMWYVHAWALHHWLLSEAPDDVRDQFARWVSVMEHIDAGPSEIQKVGRQEFHKAFGGHLGALEPQFKAWLEKF